MSKKHILKINNCRNSMSLGIVVTLSRTTDLVNLKPQRMKLKIY